MTKIRERNPRGQGAKLREDIIAAATALLEQSGNEAEVSLRAVARKAGITAPSIYAHFEDRDAVLAAVIALAFDELVGALNEATADIADPVQRLHAGCHAYLRFAADRPHRYRVLFERQRDFTAGLTHAMIHAQSAGKSAGQAAGHTAGNPVEQAAGQSGEHGVQPISGAEAFDILVDAIQRCADAERSDSVDAFADAAALWSAMHGFATLNRGLPDFPWPDRQVLEDALIDRLARIRGR